MPPKSVVKYPAGTLLFREGDASRETYVVRSGRVSITRRIDGRDRFVVDLGPGEIFGEMALLLGELRSGTATIAEDAELLVLAPETFEELLANSPQVAYRLIVKLTERVAAANAQIASLLVKDHSARFIHLLAALADRQGRHLEEGRRFVAIGIDELYVMAGMEIRQTMKEVLDRMSMAGLVTFVQGGIEVAPKETLDAWLELVAEPGHG
ncbi:MAG: Crp/Fnr family transcriptional regulator [Deltaproteobacteria bacterium]|nr:Crp/Fnr family transcriptional regulator [Deltaproteobacteria bacterium]